MSICATWYRLVLCLESAAYQKHVQSRSSQLAYRLHGRLGHRTLALEVRHF